MNQPFRAKNILLVGHSRKFLWLRRGVISCSFLECCQKPMGKTGTQLCVSHNGGSHVTSGSEGWVTEETQGCADCSPEGRSGSNSCLSLVDVFGCPQPTAH